jgi:hypothetical protein
VIGAWRVKRQLAERSHTVENASNTQEAYLLFCWLRLVFSRWSWLFYGSHDAMATVISDLTAKIKQKLIL